MTGQKDSSTLLGEAMSVARDPQVEAVREREHVRKVYEVKMRTIFLLCLAAGIIITSIVFGLVLLIPGVLR